MQRPRQGKSAGGGVSQWSIGGFSEETAPTNAQSSNAFATGSNQNSGNVITGRSSTRVVREPGGASQWSIGSYSQENVTPPTDQQEGKMQSLADFVSSSSEKPYAFGARTDGGSSNAFANGNNQNSGNSIASRPTTKVQQAPGGASSIVFG